MYAGAHERKEKLYFESATMYAEGKNISKRFVLFCAVIACFVIGTIVLAGLTLSKSKQTNRVLCNAGGKNGPLLPGCEVQGGGVEGVTLAFQNHLVDNLIFLSRIISTLGVNITTQTDESLRFGLAIESLSPNLIVGKNSNANASVVLNLTQGAFLLCNAGSNTNASLPECPVGGNFSGLALIFTNLTDPEITYVRRLASISPYVTSAIAGPADNLIDVNVNFTNVAAGTILCNFGDNTGTGLARCPGFGNSSGLTLAYYDPTFNVTRIKRLTGVTNAIVVSTLSAESPNVVVSLNHTFPPECDVNCTANRLVVLANSNSGRYLNLGLEHDFIVNNSGSAAWGGQNATFENTTVSAVFACQDCQMLNTTGSCILSGQNLLINGRDNDNIGIMSGFDILVDDKDTCFSAGGRSNTLAGRYSSALGGFMNFLSFPTRSAIFGGHDITMAGPSSFSSAAGGSDYVVEERPSFNSGNVHTLGFLATNRIFSVQFNDTFIVSQTTTVGYFGVILILGTASDTATIIFPSGFPNGVVLLVKTQTESNLNITCIEGTTLCPLGSSCVLEGQMLITKDYSGAKFIYLESGARFIQYA